MNAFVTGIKSEGPTPTSMWETLLKRKYSEFILSSDDLNILKIQCDIFEKYLTEDTTNICGGNEAAEVEGTTGQSSSQPWVSSRCFIITASDSKLAVEAGEKSALNIVTEKASSLII